MIKSNYHTHSTFCDGRDSIESIVECAIQKGFKYLGFSSHSYIKGDDCWTLKENSLPEYISEVLRVKEKYKSQISILLGVEQDTCSNSYDYDFDYIIGSMHSIEKNGKIYPIDQNIESFKKLLEEVYLNDFDSLCKDYFEQLQKSFIKTKGDIIGHFDLITKYVEVLKLILPKNYLKYAENAIINIIKDVKIFEINTGGMARGHKTIPYPSKEILSLILKYGGSIIINTDCHDKEKLDFGLENAIKLAKEVGFNNQVILTEKGFETVDL